MWSSVTAAGTENGPAPPSRSKHSATLLAGHVYLLGGRNGNLPLKDLWRYSLAESKWEELYPGGERPPALQEHSAVAYKDCLYVFGGELGFSAGTETPLWVYNVKTNVWRKVRAQRGCAVPRGRRGHTALVHRGQMLIYGGYQDLRGSSSELWAFHFETESWHLLSSSESGPAARHKHSAVLHGDAMYIYGGMTDLQERNDCWRWDVNSASWSMLKNKPGPGPLHGHAACRLPSCMLIFGGESGGLATNELWRFHFGTETWEKLSVPGPKPQPRAESVALAVSELLIRGTSMDNSKPRPRNQRPRLSSNRMSPNEIPSARQSFLKEISKLSQINLSRLSHPTKCSYTVLSGHDDNEESPQEANTYYPFQQVDIEVVEPSTGMVKSRSANTLARRRQKVSEGTTRTVDVSNVNNTSGSGMTRDPISVPNFRALTLPTPVLTPVEAARLVFVDPDENSDNEERKEPPTSRLIEVQEERRDFAAVHQACQPTRGDSYSSHLYEAALQTPKTPTTTKIPTSASVRFADLEEGEESTSDYASIEARSPGDPLADDDWLSGKRSKPHRPIVASSTIREGQFGFCNPNYLGLDETRNHYHHHHHHHHQQQQQQQQQQVEMQQVTEQQLVPQTSVDREQQTQQEIEAQENMDRSGVQSLPIGGSGSEVTDFAETLDLSQEDIQKTLSANMVPPSPSPSPADNSMINPMDFIDSSDDVLVNLDAFDVFGDLPELHDFEADQTKHEEQRGGPENDVGCHPGTTVHIAEYSPEWSYTEGGVKVLVAGPWTGGSGSQSYSVLFDAEPVEACLVQPGVLRCRCPAHAPGIASLQVACDGFVVSDSVAFEYRRAPTSEPSPEKALLDRLADVEARLQGPGPPSPAAHLEERLVAYCQDAVVRPWRAGAEPLQSGGPTLLHLAAGLGYSRLACALLHWRAENPSSVLDAEVDALRQDSAGLTPLAWACAAGHADTARILYRWNAMALRVRDCQNRTATELAAENGHAAISEELNQLEARRQDERLFLRPASPSPRRPSQDSGLDLALCGSPLLDNMELLQEDESSLGLSEQGMESAPTPQETVGEEDARVLTLAEQIIAALPERIKRAEGDSPSSSSPPPLAAPLSPLEDALMEQMPLDSGELFDSYRDCNGGAASISDADADADASPSSPSSSCLTPDSPSPPPTTADFCEFLQLQLHLDGNGNAHNAYYSPNGGERRLNGMLGSGALTATASDGGSEADLSRLTLSDREQRELYHAARMIQKAYRNYKGRQRQEEAERHAAVLIQQYYRRHKQYAYHRQATRAALVIQNNYRNYRARPGSTSIRQQAVHQQAAHQAARKIQQFMRQSKINLSWDDSRPTAERQGRRKREREAASGHFTGGCCPPKLALI